MLLLKRKLEQKARNHSEALCCNDKRKGLPLELESRSVPSHAQDIPLFYHEVGLCSHTGKLSYCQMHPLGRSSYTASGIETNKALSELEQKEETGWSIGIHL